MRGRGSLEKGDVTSDLMEEGEVGSRLGDDVMFVDESGFVSSWFVEMTSLSGGVSVTPSSLDLIVFFTSSNRR